MWNNKLDIYEKEWLDVVFSARNTTYGAYDLRKNAASATNKALFIVTGVVALLIGGKITYDHMPKSVDPVTTYAEMPLVLTEEINIPEEKEEEIIIPQEKAVQKIAQDQPAIDLVRFVEPEVTDSRKVTEDVATQEDMKDKMTARISLKKVSGGSFIARGEFGPTNQEGNMTGNTSGELYGGVSNSDALFEQVEVMPEPPGGMSAFVQWVGKSYNYPDAALQQGIKGSVLVSFVVERDGSLTDLKIVRDLRYGTGEEALRVLRKAKKWSPGIQNGRKVRVSYTLPITLSTI